MTVTPQQLKLLSEIGSGLTTVNDRAVVHVDALIAQGLVTGVRLGYFDLRLTPEGRHLLGQAGQPPHELSGGTHRRRRGD